MSDNAPIKTEITKINSKCWEWEIIRSGEHLAGGYATTKKDAENDAAISAKTIESES